MIFLISIAAIITIIGVIIIEENMSSNDGLNLLGVIFLASGVMLFIIAAVELNDTLNALNKDKKIFVSYIVEHNCTDEKLKERFKKDIIQYKIEKYSKKLEKEK